jgi:hypothetical protein
VAPAVARPRSIGGRLNSAPEFQQGIEPFPASRGGIYRVRAMKVNTPKFSNREFA